MKLLSGSKRTPPCAYLPMNVPRNNRGHESKPTAVKGKKTYVHRIQVHRVRFNSLFNSYPSSSLIFSPDVSRFIFFYFFSRLRARGNIYTCSNATSARCRGVDKHGHYGINLRPTGLRFQRPRATDKCNWNACTLEICLSREREGEREFLLGCGGVDRRRRLGIAGTKRLPAPFWSYAVETQRQPPF